MTTHGNNFDRGCPPELINPGNNDHDVCGKKNAN
jgi:hypothetical protein